MSAQCKYFVRNAWKKDLCTNCFKLREEHVEVLEISRSSTGKAPLHFKTDNIKPQGILKGKTSSQGRKKVVFPECLTEIIGYGGDDFSDQEEFELSDPSGPEDDVPDSEEERTLCNLTRANTNFNTVTANLSAVAAPEAKKSFASLMLGKTQKDADGRKKTLLVSVTPFGGDDIVPTAKRPNEKKASNFSSFSKTGSDVADDRSEVTLKSVRSTDERHLDDRSEKESRADGASLEKIVDMPLITSSNLISVIQRSDSLTSSEPSSNRTTESYQKSADVEKYGNKQTSEKKTGITRTPAIKKTDGDKQRLSLQNAYKQCANTVDEYIVSKSKDNAFPSRENGLGYKTTGIELTLSPLNKLPDSDDETSSRNAGNPEKSKGAVRGKDVNKISVTADCDKLADRDVRKVEEEAAAEVMSMRKFSFEESRELAGEPDGEADEEMIEPPSLPRSPPPMDLRPATRNHLPLDPELSSTSEPRSSFLHGGEKKTKPAVPQKPATLPPKPLTLPKSPTSSIGPSFKKIAMNSHVLPPPHVQNVTSKSTHFESTPRNTQNDKIQSTADKSPFRITQADQLTTLSTQAYSSTVKSQTQSQSSTFVSKTVNVSQSLNLATKTFHHQSTAQAQARSAYSRPEEEHVKSKAELDYSSSQGAHETENTRIPAKVPASPKTKPAPLHLSQALREDDGVEDVPISPDMEAELIRSPNKRRMAPKPPAATSPMDDGPGSLFARNPGASLKSDSPVVREKEKRERASSCSPKFRKAISDLPDPSGAVQPPEPAPRRIISLSQDSLANGDKMEEKKKGRSRFSLKKFLRMGSKKDVEIAAGGSSKIDEIPTTPQPKPRLEIIHPLELDGAAVEVLSSDRVARLSEDVTDSKTENFQPQHAQSMSNIHNVAARPSKPPPPPRNQSLDDWSRLDPAHKPARPPPPRTEMKLPPRNEKPPPKAWQPPTSPSTSDSIYANLAAEDVAGEVRSALAPSKPQRTASMRDQAICQPPVKKRTTTAQDEEYETLNTLPHGADFPTTNDSNVYECLSSSPECDSNLELRHGNVALSNAKRKSDSSALNPGNDFKYHHQPFTRSTSLPYCGSETESEHYAPYSFYTGDEGPEEDQDWKGKDHESKVSRLRQRRGRSIVHRSLEDNYGAVVVANHEALAQVLEQLNQTPPIPPALRSIKTASLRFSDFTLDRNTSVPIGRRIFYSATWNGQNVTVCIAFDLALHVSRKEFHLSPITEFTDLVPEYILEEINQEEKRNTEATISVLPRVHVNTIKSFGAMSKDTNDEGILRESSFVMLQLVNALKSLQARGIEDAPKSLNSVVLCREDKNTCYRLYLLQGLNMEVSGDLEEEKVSLCECTLIAMDELFLADKLPLIKELLNREKAVTLSQVKSVLEFSLWGPADVTLGGPREREVALQRWLDLEKATVLHALVRARAPLTITDEYHLLFLVRTSAKIMCEASILLDAQRNGLIVNSNS